MDPNFAAFLDFLGTGLMAALFFFLISLLGVILIDKFTNENN